MHELKRWLSQGGRDSPAVLDAVAKYQATLLGFQNDDKLDSLEHEEFYAVLRTVPIVTNPLQPPVTTVQSRHPRTMITLISTHGAVIGVRVSQYHNM